MKTALYLAAIIALLAVGGSAVWVAHSTAQLRADLNATQESLAASVESARADLAITQAAMVNVLAKRTGELTTETRKLRGAVVRTLKNTDRSIADLVKIRTDLRATLSAVPPLLDRANTAVDSANSAFAAVPPLLNDARDSWDDLYPDLKAAIESAAVTSTSAAQVSQEVRRVAPDVATDAQKTAKNVWRITSWPVVLGKALLSIPKKLFWFL